MADYVKQEWKDAVVDENGNIIEAGTLINKERMEHIEEGILEAHKSVKNLMKELTKTIQEYSVIRIYSQNELCYSDGVIYRSLADENLGNPLTDQGWWMAYGRTVEEDYEQLINYAMAYDNGNECEEVGGVWSADGYSYSGYTVTAGTKNSDNIYTEGASNTFNLLGTSNTIEFSAYKTLYVDCSTSGSSYDNSLQVRITMSKAVESAETMLFANHTTRTIKTYDISSMIGNYYVSVMSGAQSSRSANIYNLFLTKPDDYQTLCAKAGITAPNTIEELIADTEALTAIFNSEAAVKFMVKQCTGDFMVGILNDETVVSILVESPYLNKVIANPHWAKFMMMLPTAQSLLHYTMLYDSGNECEAITGGWVKTYLSNGSGGTATKNADNLYTISSSGSSYNNCGFATANGIDDTDQTFNMIAIYTEYTEAYSCNGTGNLGSVQISGVCVEAGTVTEKTLVRKESTIGGLHLFLSSGKTSRKQYYYNVFLSKADNFTEWASKADITVSDIDTLLADSTAMATLMSNQEAVDYLVGCTGDLMVAICNSEVAMSALVNNIAYDTLFKHPVWYKFMTMIPTSLEAMKNVAKSIPTMISNTEPRGVCSSLRGAYSSASAEYKAFDKEATAYGTLYPYQSGEWVQYEFENLIDIFAVSLTANSDRTMDYRVLIGENEDNLVEVAKYTETSGFPSDIYSDGNDYEVTLVNPIRAKYVRCVFNVWTSLTGNNAALFELNAYGKAVSE
ncbi:MAG: hypothetical protein ACI4LO_09630 [Anaerovoracaceae bacterium]